MSESSRRDDLEKGDRPSGLPPRHPHALAEAGGVTGALVGAVVGAIAGPIGAAVGGALGSAACALAGESIERAEHARAEHDRELDDAIGVTTGNLGTPPETKHPSAEVLSEARANDRDRAEG